jgi:hypothetical protein
LLFAFQSLICRIMGFAYSAIVWLQGRNPMRFETSVPPTPSFPIINHHLRAPDFLTQCRPSKDHGSALPRTRLPLRLVLRHFLSFIHQGNARVTFYPCKRLRHHI